VIHAGFVPGKYRDEEARKLMAAGLREQANKMVAEDLMERAAVSQPYIDSVIASMRELAVHAEKAGVRLGLETRYYLGEIPMLDEWATIFEAVGSPALGYWHDAGHAHTMEFLGVADHEDYLKAYGDRLIGMHLHDSIGASDHRALGRGQIDFGKIVEYTGPETALVLEIHGQASAAEVVRSRELLKGIIK